MHEQKNLFLAIGLSIVIIIAFQFLFPQQTMVTPSSQQSTDQIQQAPSTNEQLQVQNTTTTKTKEEVIVSNKRVLINAPSLKGSINLKGAILDDLLLLNYKESLDENSKNINLFYPDQTANPYYLEIGWKSSNKSSNIDLPNLETEWSTTGQTLSPTTPITLYWTNKDNITFKIYYEIDDQYMLQVNQEINNKSIKAIDIFPYRLIKRINLPDTINGCDSVQVCVNSKCFEMTYSWCIFRLRMASRKCGVFAPKAHFRRLVVTDFSNVTKRRQILSRTSRSFRSKLSACF